MMKIVNIVENLFFNKPSLILSLIFNFHYLPFKQAIRLPILLYNPIFNRLRRGRGSIFSLKGKVIINSKNISYGMIQLGPLLTTSHHNAGFIWANEGTVVFTGKAFLAQGCAIRNSGVLEFGHNVLMNANSKILCFYHIKIGNVVRISWDSLICDTNFHPLKKISTGEKNKPYAEVIIGDKVWIAQKTLVLAGTKIDESCIVSGGSIVTKRLSAAPYSIIANSPSEVVSTGKYYRDFDDDGCKYEKYIYEE